MPLQDPKFESIGDDDVKQHIEDKPKLAAVAHCAPEGIYFHEDSVIHHADAQPSFGFQPGMARFDGTPLVPDLENIQSQTFRPNLGATHPKKARKPKLAVAGSSFQGANQVLQFQRSLSGQNSPVRQPSRAQEHITLQYETRLPYMLAPFDIPNAQNLTVIDPANKTYRVVNYEPYGHPATRPNAADLPTYSISTLEISTGGTTTIPPTASECKVSPFKNTHASSHENSDSDHSRNDHTPPSIGPSSQIMGLTEKNPEADTAARKWRLKKGGLSKPALWPRFGETEQLGRLVDGMGRSIHVKIYGDIESNVVFDYEEDKNAFVAYRRNYFSLQDLRFSLETQPDEAGFFSRHWVVRSSDNDNIVGPANFFLQVASVRHGAVGEESGMSIIQYGRKRERKHIQAPQPKKVHPWQVNNQEETDAADGFVPERLVEYTRLQFKSATKNNGERRQRCQDYNFLRVQLGVMLPDHTTLIVAQTRSNNFVVRGRSPGAFPADELGRRVGRKRPARE